MSTGTFDMIEWLNDFRTTPLATVLFFVVSIGTFMTIAYIIAGIVLDKRLPPPRTWFHWVAFLWPDDEWRSRQKKPGKQDDDWQNTKWMDAHWTDKNWWDKVK